MFYTEMNYIYIFLLLDKNIQHITVTQYKLNINYNA